jgi:DNA-binding PadR family transcriptional regulator
MSTLGYAILGLLAAQPRTGYDVAKLMRAPIGYMWTAHHSQIYPELAGLEDDGMVSAAVIDGPGPRDNKRYEITPAGWHGLQDWWLDWLLDRLEKVEPQAGDAVDEADHAQHPH